MLAALSVACILNAVMPVTFNDAGKAVYLHNASTLYSRECGGDVCVLRHMWFGGKWPGYNYTRLQIYVDNEETASIDARFNVFHGMGFDDDSLGPWSAGALFGRSGHPSGIFNTYEIPFYKNISIVCTPYTTYTQPAYDAKRFWWIFRGVEQYTGGDSVKLAGIDLPIGTRLRLFSQNDKLVQAYDELAFFESATAGTALLNVLSVTGASITYLEGMVRGYASGVESLHSSGTEDYFLGTYYFDAGAYQNPLAGVTHLTHDAEERFCGYRVHTDDPILFKPNYSMTWRCGEQGHSGNSSCVASTMALVYQWE